MNDTQAHAITTTFRPFARAHGRSARFLKQVGRRAFAWYANRRDYRTLASLDDHMLRDIGISRSQIHEAVYGRMRANRDA